MSYIPSPGIFFILAQDLIKSLSCQDWAQTWDLPTSIPHRVGVTSVHHHMWLDKFMNKSPWKKSSWFLTLSHFLRTGLDIFYFENSYWKLLWFFLMELTSSTSATFLAIGCWQASWPPRLNFSSKMEIVQVCPACLSRPLQELPEILRSGENFMPKELIHMYVFINSKTI